MSVADAARRARGSSLRLRARWALPIHLPPIEDAEVVISEGRIAHVGKAPRNAVADVDLGMAAILPGLVNVHSHLEYTVFRGLLEDVPFFTWIRSLTALKAHLTRDEWLSSALLGAAEMLAAGITTIADCADAGASLPALLASGQRGIVFREVFGIEAEPSAETIVSHLSDKIIDMRAHIARSGGEERVSVGISPHAPYTVRGELFSALADYARREGLRQAIHVAESPAEEALFRDGTGAFADMFARRGIRWETPGTSPTRYIAEQGGLDAPTLAIHGVHMDAEDAAVLARKGASIAHCPKSNGKLGTGLAPARTWLDAGLAVGLGTDSVASNNNADLFEEMRAAIFSARARMQDERALSAKEALMMATTGGAKALGLEQETGALRVGRPADLCIVRLDGLHITPAADDNPVAALVYGARASDVAVTMVEGRVLYEGGRCLMLDVPRLHGIVGETRKRLRREWERSLAASAP